MRQTGRATAALLAASLGLSACAGDLPWTDGSEVTRLAQTDPEAFAAQLNSDSTVIQDLLSRRSILPADSPYDQVARAVLEANARPAEAELRIAQLRAAAASKNWLPTLGPQITLRSLSDIVTQVVVEQVVFDNGRKKGERDFTKADVEVAAVVLAQETNDRVAEALGLYLTAAEGREIEAVDGAALRDMGQFEYIMSERVKGGVSDKSDLQILRAKLAEIRASRRTAAETSQTALAELNAMSTLPLNDIQGGTVLEVSSYSAQPLDVSKAAAERTRSIAAAQVERGGLLPGVNLSTVVGEGGGVAWTLGGARLGLGTNARLRALEQAQEAADRRLQQADEDAHRELSRLESALAAKRRQATEAAGLTRQAKANLDLFQAQYAAGQRQVMDVVGVYETFAARQTSQIALTYEARRLAIEIARLQGVLVEGQAI